MSETKKDNNGNGHKSWFERISQLFSEPKDKEDLVEIVTDAEQREIIDTDVLNMIKGVLEVTRVQVGDIMIPRSQMVVVKKDDTPDIFLPKIIESAHSRFPVVGDDRDEVIGILLAKDCLTACFDRTIDFNLKKILRPVAFVPESKRLDAMLREFRASRNHMAVVIDEYGGVAGLITIEDVLEQIVGEIEDEHDIDSQEDYIRKISGTNYAVNALTPIEEFNGFFKAELGHEEFDTIGGLVMHALGHLPKRGETVTIDRYTFKVLSADNRRIQLLQATMIEQKE